MSELAPITQLLAESAQGDTAARDRLWSLIYDELRAIARRQLAAEGSGRTLQATALVNEAYLRLLGSEEIDWNDRCHFFAAAAKKMRHIRVDDARKRRSLKRGGAFARVGHGGEGQVDLSTLTVCEDDVERTLAIDEALKRLADFDPLSAEIVELHFFGGLTFDQVSQALGVAPRTVDKYWQSARAWLFGELGGLRDMDGDA